MEYKAEILMATYNGGKYLREQIESILAQDTDSWHLTISDDGSADDTVEIIEEYVSNYPDKIGRVHSGRKFGNARDHFFWLMSKCDAKYMMFADQDDVWDSDKVRLMLESLESGSIKYGPDVPLLVFSDQRVVDENLNVINESFMDMQLQNPRYIDYRNLIFQNIVSGCCMAINKSLSEIALRYKNAENIVMHDWWVAIVAAKFGHIAYVSKALSNYRQHGDNSVGARDVSSKEYYIYKLEHIDEAKQNEANKRRQAREFAESYEKLLPANELSLIREFGSEHRSLGFKLRYCKYIYTLHRKVGFVMMRD